MELKDNKPTNFDLFKALDLTNMYMGYNIELKVNTEIYFFNRLVKLFEKYQIKHTEYTFSVDCPNRFDLHFGRRTDFQDLYIIVAILRIFGLQSVFYSYEDDCEVVIGSYITEYGRKLAVSQGMLVDEFLSFPFFLTTKEFLFETFGNEDIGEVDKEEDDNNNDYDDSFDNNDESFMVGDPRYDSNENPWIDVFGYGDEAETAYWNTD